MWGSTTTAADQQISALQANLSSLVQQLDAKTAEAKTAAADAAKQRELVQQITKKLDVLAKQNKTLQKESAQHAAAREHQTEAAAQTDEDARLVAAAQASAVVAPASTFSASPS